MFKLGCTSDKIWNLREFVEYLLANQKQSIEFKVYPEAVCLETLGVYRLLDNFEFKEVLIHTHNPFERHDRYKILKRDNFWFTQQPTIDPTLHAWNFKKKFFCFYHRPTASRLD